jgi:hypothetical protein
MIYSMMYGPQRKTPCPTCTSFLTAWNGTAVNLRERVAIVVTARSPIDRLIEYKKQRGFSNLPLRPTCLASTPARMSVPKTPTPLASVSSAGAMESAAYPTRGLRDDKPARDVARDTAFRGSD